MNQLLTLGAIWSLTLGLARDVQANPDEKLREIVSVLQSAWGKDFDSNYRKYMFGPSPTVILIPRTEMIEIADRRLDGRLRDGATTQGLTIGDSPNVRILVVYDDIASLLVAKTINHELGHLQLRGNRMDRNHEEARVRKTVDTAFFEKMFGRDWLKKTISDLQKKGMSVKKNGHSYKGYTPESVETFYQRLENAGMKIAKTPLHDRIVANIVFILTNSEKNLSHALDADDPS
jgi:hypothetical protein